MKTKTQTNLEAPCADVIKHAQKEWKPQEDEPSMLRKEYAAWIERVKVAQATAAKQLYDNPNSCTIQLRFHLQNFAALLSRGQMMVLKAYDLCSKGEAPDDFFAEEISAIDGFVPDLVERLHMWHGPIDSQIDIPDSFKRGVKDIDEGRLVDMEHALTADR